MADGSSFYGAPSAPGRRSGKLTAAAVVLVVVGIAVAIAKPWGRHRPAGGLGPARGGRGQPVRGCQSASALPRSTALPTSLPHPLAVAFTTAPSPRSETWAGLEWQRLAPDDPLGIVRTEVTSGETSVAIGDIAGTTSTTVWASTDRTHWQPVDRGTPASLSSGLTVIGLATLAGRFVAVTEMNDYLYRYLPPVEAWTSTDGRSWTHATTLPVDALLSLTGSPPLVAAGPDGLVIATSGLAARYTTSSDGSHWDLSPRNAFPADFALDDLEGTSTGYVAIGAWLRGGSVRAAALWSADGRHWPKTPTLLPTSASRSGNAGLLECGDAHGRRPRHHRHGDRRLPGRGPVVAIARRPALAAAPDLPAPRGDDVRGRELRPAAERDAHRRRSSARRGARRLGRSRLGLDRRPALDGARPLRGHPECPGPGRPPARRSARVRWSDDLVRPGRKPLTRRRAGGARCQHLLDSWTPVSGSASRLESILGS